MTNTILSLNLKAIQALKQSKSNEEKYEILLNFNTEFEQFDNPEFKTKDNLFEGCTVRTWLFDIESIHYGYSESRLINGLIYLVINNINNLKNMDEIIEFYDIGFFYSNIRISSLEKVFDYLITNSNS
jgi:sulfur transfer protein SufE